MRKVKVNSFESLELELTRLQLHSQQLENEMGYRITYFSKNYKKMVLNALIPGSTKHSGAFGIGMSVAKMIWGNGNVKNFASKAVITALKFIGIKLGVNIFNRIIRNRRKKKAAASA